MRAINKAGFIDTPYPVQDSLFFKIQGDAKSIELAYKTVQETVQRHGSSRFQFAATDQEAEEIWQNRKYALMSTLAAEPGYRCWTTDVCVPVSRLPQLVYETKKDLKNSGLKSTIVGHVGDGKVHNRFALICLIKLPLEGNFHALILFHNDEELESVREAVHRLVHRAIALDGTCKLYPRFYSRTLRTYGAE